MLRFHFNISEDIKAVVQSIRAEMRPELIPLAEEKANFGKLVKTAVREMWSLEYEVDGLQSQFADSIGTIDLDNMDVDFIEDMMLKSKPLQGILNDIRGRQIRKLEDEELWGGHKGSRLSRFCLFRGQPRSSERRRKQSSRGRPLRRTRRRLMLYCSCSRGGPSRDGYYSKSISLQHFTLELLIPIPC